MQEQALVSCIMPTYNRREFVPHSLRYFLRQDYPSKELIIIDDGTDNIEDLVPRVPNIKYYRLPEKISLGEKLNLACEYSSGNIIVNWDDDDWYDTHRITYQVQELIKNQTVICGINNLLYYDIQNQKGFNYIYPADQRTWLLGSSLCYTKEFWESSRFAHINVGMDGLFVWSTTSNRITVLPDHAMSVHLIHESNVSPKKTEGIWWHPYPLARIQEIMKEDWIHYQKKVNHHPKKINSKKIIIPSPTPKRHKKLKNIFACLIHENQDCIIDLVRNLHYHDPSSIILLYNGGSDPSLLKSPFPFEKFGAIHYPDPKPLKWGYLHPFALDIFEYAAKNFNYDLLTIVDSDQLAIREGYSSFMSEHLSSKPDIGLLASDNRRITPHNNTVHPAIKAHKEYELWKPFLQQFPDGENQFPYWTFWPSTTFTNEACTEILKIFKVNTSLQNIMQKSNIWATEEIIFPTLVKLMGFEIGINPCSYDFVKYRKTFSIHEVEQALLKRDSYWIHPVERTYNNPLRKHIRQHFNHYNSKPDNTLELNNSDTDLLLPIELIQKVKNIEGWLSDKEAELLMAITLKACLELPHPGTIVEIGSFHGKSTVIIGEVVKTLCKEAKVYAIDSHEGMVGAVGQVIQNLTPSLEMFVRNIQNAGLSDVVKLINRYSYDVIWDKPISLLFIDGLHDYLNVSRDFWHFSDWITQGGYVAFHDYADYYPGVRGFVDELLSQEYYRSVRLSDSLIILQKL